MVRNAMLIGLQLSEVVTAFSSRVQSSGSLIPQIVQINKNSVFFCG